jgi:hypothetical protein
MAKLQGDNLPSYILSYSRWVSIIRIGIAIVLAGVAVGRWVVAWVSFLRPVVDVMGRTAWGTPEGLRLLYDTMAAQPLRPLIAAHVGILFTAGALALLYALLPDLAIDDEGLAVRTLTGWQVIPWTAVTVVRIQSFAKSKRRLVLVQGKWARWSPWPRLMSACMGAGWEPGVLFTSDIRDFKPLILRLYQEVKQASPQALFDDEFVSPSALLVLEPTPTLDTLVEQAQAEGWPIGISAQAIGAVAAGLVLVELMMLILHGGIWWAPLAIIAWCGFEWLIGAFYLYALAEPFPGEIELYEAALLYPLPQIPRALLTVPMMMLIAAGLPFPAALLGLAGVLWSVILTVFLVRRVFLLRSILPAAIGGAFQALFQFLLLALVFG